MRVKRKPEVVPARIHLLAAKAAPVVVVLRRKPARLFHVLRWDTERDEIESGSWFHGRIHELNSDLSFDGQFMVYAASGKIQNWTGICRPPKLRTEVDWPDAMTGAGGGVFVSADRLEVNTDQDEAAVVEAIEKVGDKLPFEIGLLDRQRYRKELKEEYPRFYRDGFRRVGPRGREEDVKGTRWQAISRDDPEWVLRPTEGHPELRVRYRGYRQGMIFEWDLPELPGVLDPQVSWAVYDSLGQLIVARRGVLYRYTLSDLLAGKPSSVFDLEPLEKPRFGDSATAP